MIYVSVFYLYSNVISLSDVFWLNIYLKDNQIKINANDTIEGYNLSDYCFKLKVNRFIIDYIKYTSQLAIKWTITH